jgi:imidazolonepropionase-like amidohydrolase
MRVTATAGLLLFAFGHGCSEPEPTASATPEVDTDVIAFVNVNVVPMTSDRVLEQHTVLVDEGRISDIGPTSEITIPTGATRIDGTGRYLMPGLTETHGHLPTPGMPVEVTENVLFLYVANGVTTVRGMQGSDSQIPLREWIRTGDVIGPQLVLGSPSMSGTSVTTPEQAEALVRSYDEAGYDLVKVHEGLAPEVYDAIAGTAGQLGMPFAGHVSDRVGLFHALEVGQSTIDHLDNYVEALVPEGQDLEEPPGLRGAHELLERIDESRIDLLVQKTLEADGSVVPTMVLWESGIYATRPSEALLEERPEVAYMPPEMVERWIEAVDARVEAADPEAMMRLAALRRRILKALYDGGVRILLGTDSPQIFSVPGFSIHREMKLYTEVGMTPYDVLAAGTKVVGEFLNGNFGTIEVGQRADLLLLEANPLEDVANVSKRAGVMVNGEFITEEAIQKRLKEIAAYYEG